MKMIPIREEMPLFNRVVFLDLSSGFFFCMTGAGCEPCFLTEGTERLYKQRILGYFMNDPEKTGTAILREMISAVVEMETGSLLLSPKDNGSTDEEKN